MLSPAKIKKLQILRRKIGMDDTTYYNTIGVGSTRDLSEKAASEFIDAFEKELAKQGNPNIPAGRVSAKMRSNIIRYYKHKLKWHDAHLWNWAQKVVGHDIPKGSNHDRFNWLSPADGRKVFEGLKAIYNRQGTKQ